MAEKEGKKEGKQVSQLKQTNPSNSLEAKKGLDSSRKAPGQVGLWAPNTMDAIRKPPKESRVDTGERVFGGVSSPQISDQTYDVHAPIRKVNPPTKKKDEK